MRMSVQFAENAEVKLVRDLIKYKKDLWFTKNEIESFTSVMALLLRDITSSGMTLGQYAVLYHEDTSVFLGLESYLTPTTAREIKLRRRVLVNAVLSEQQHQRQAGICDPGKLARISETLSEYSVSRARLIGRIHDDRDGASDEAATQATMT